MGDYRDLLVYKKSFRLAMEIFHQSKNFPAEERMSLTSQIRRCSRSVCANIVEAYKRRRYKGYFISKLNDAECENAETQVWIEFARSCSYLPDLTYQEFTIQNVEITKLIYFMINHPDKFI